MGKGSKKTVLHVERSGAEGSAIRQWIADRDLPYQLIPATTKEEIQAVMEETVVDAAIIHIREEDPDPFAIIQSSEKIPFVVLAEATNGGNIRKAIQYGAVDFVVKDGEGRYLSAITQGLRRAVQKSEAERERQRYQQELEQIVADRAQVLLEANQRLTMEAQHRLESLDALREAESRYTMIFNSTSDAVFIHNLQGELLDVNDAACEKLGFTRAELLERTVDELSLDPELITSTKIETLTREGQLRLETDIQGKDSTTYPVELQSRLMEYRGRNAVLTISRDISQRKKVEKALAESEEKYRRFFQTSQDAVFMTTEDGEWIDMNQAAVRLFGYEGKEELMAVDVRDLYHHPGDREKHLAEIKEQGFARDYRLELRKKSGETFPALITSTVYQEGGEVIGYQGTIRDLSRAQAIERERQETVQQQAAISSLTNELRSTLDLEEMYESILSHVRELFEVDYFILYKAEGNQLTPKFVWGGGQSLDPDFFPGVSSLASKRLTPLGLALQDGQAVNVPDLTDMAGKNQAHYQFDSHSQVHRGKNVPEHARLTRSALLVPLEVDDEEIGILEIQSFTGGAYQEPDVELLKQIASTIAIGLQKLYLLESHQKQNQRLRALHLIDQAITENQSLPMMMDTLRDQLVTLLEVDAADVLYYHPELNALKIITQTGFRTNPLKYTELQLGEGPAGEAALSRQTVHIPDIQEAGTAFNRSPDFDQEEFVTYIGLPLVAKGELVGVLEIFHREPLDVDQEWIDFLETLAGQAAIAIDQRNLYKNLRRSKDQLDEAYDSIIESWAQAMELREIETTGHGQRLVDLSLKVARRLGVKGKKLDNIRRGAYLHDIGKMGIPDRILKKEGKLTKEEREEIGQHPLYAYEILRSNEYLRPALDIPLYHHERWDGLGYPEGLKGKEIPLAARIFAVVDVWDALRSGRPYREAWSDERALAHIKEESGTHFDPQVVKAFLEIVES